MEVDARAIVKSNLTASVAGQRVMDQQGIRVPPLHANGDLDNGYFIPNSFQQYQQPVAVMRRHQQPRPHAMWGPYSSSYSGTVG